MATSRPAISAVYTSPQPPHTSHTFRHAIAAPLPVDNDQQGAVAAKKTYLSELRGLVTLVQTEVNAFLTERMDEDKERAGNGQAAKDAEREAKEEAIYGEETVEEDDA